MGFNGLMKLDIQKFASGTISGGNYSSRYQYYMTWSSTSNGSAANTSNVTLNWIYKKIASDPDGAWNKAGTSKVTLVINGNSSGAMRADFDLRSAAVGTTSTIASYTVNNVPHNADGSCTINVSGTHVTDISFGTVSIGSTPITLDKIPRYANITSFSVSQRDETTVKFNWGADAACDWAWYSANNGATWHNLASNNVVSGLNAGTTYNFKLRVRRTDSQLVSESGTVQQSTYNYPYVNSAPNFIIGNNVTIGLYNPLSRNTSVAIKYGNTTVKTLTTTSNSVVYDSSQDSSTWYGFIPNNASGNYTASATYSGNPTAAKTGTFSVDTVEDAPDFNLFTWEDVNPTTLALTGSNNVVVLENSDANNPKGYSNIKVTIPVANKATAKNEATMSKYHFECGAQSTDIAYSDNADVYGTINNASSSTFKVSAIDSRELPTAVTLTAANVVNYRDLVKGEASISRVGEVSEQATLTFTGTMWVGNFGVENNEITNVTYRYKTGYDDWTTGETTIVPTVAQNGTFTFTGLIKGDTDTGFDEGNVYTIEFTVYDQLSSITYTVTLGAGTPHLAWYKDGLSIMGKYDENRNDALQVNGNSNFKGNILKNGSNIFDLIYPVGSIYMSMNNTSPATLFGVGTWERLSGGFLYGAVNSTGTGNSTGTATNAATGNTGSTTLTIDQIPSHDHTNAYGVVERSPGSSEYPNTGWDTGFKFGWNVNTGSRGGGQGHTHTLNSHTHNIPYMAVYMWKRTA